MSQAVSPSQAALAARLADAAAEVARRYFRTKVAVDDKPDLSPVTVADREAERAVRAILAAERPEDGIVGEEFGIERADARWVWVIDPIDGTKSFIAGRPIFGTLIALLRDGVPVLGVIDQPIVRDRWIGGEGHPTTLNGEPVRVRPCPGGLAAAMVSSTAPEALPGDDLTAFQRVSRAAKVTMWGGDCYSYGLLAAGFGDLVIESGLKLYDFAALAPVVTAAGGTMTDWEGRPLDAQSAGRVIAAGDPAVHRVALERLRG
jgi:inositol-phosphate phosphatase / L-galactose 1-phosphate phosphatase / histidinol-phosphatase